MLARMDFKELLENGLAASERRTDKLEDELAASTLITGQLKDELAAFTLITGQLQDELAFSRLIAVRDLLDRVREGMLERPLKPAERSVDGWDTYVKEVKDVDLTKWGLSREDLVLTRYGKDTLQWQGSLAAHNFVPAVIARAVLHAPSEEKDSLRRVFRFVFNVFPEEWL